MTLQLKNTLTGNLEPFQPSTADHVDLYYCGLTVSDVPHIGHARSWIHVDVLRRWLEHLGYSVNHVENFTDVNEKIVARIGERDSWTDESAVAEAFIDRVLADMRSLNLKRATVYPRVSEHIEEIIVMIDRLIETGYAYESNGSVYFDVPAFDGYGCLSNQNLDDIAPDQDHPEKRHPADFALWKAGEVDPEDIAEHVKTEEIDLEDACSKSLTWESPWGRGRPGWHIECSAMSTTHLGDTFDIHAAGRDILFPHNENEIAQAEAATGEQYARYWLHIGLLEIEEEKMSSSLDNFLTVEEAVTQYGANTVRTFLLSASHETTQSYSTDALEEAASRFDRLDRAYRRASDAIDSANARTDVKAEPLEHAVATARSDFPSAMNDNLNTRKALSVLSTLATAINEHLDSARDGYDYRALREALDTFDTFGEGVLGLDFGKESGDASSLAEPLIELILDLREDARAEENYERADAIRAKLTDLGIDVQDDEGEAHFEITSRSQ